MFWNTLNINETIDFKAKIGVNEQFTQFQNLKSIDKYIADPKKSKIILNAMVNNGLNLLSACILAYYSKNLSNKKLKKLIGHIIVDTRNYYKSMR